MHSKDIYLNDIEKVLVTETEIKVRLKSLAAKIALDYQNENIDEEIILITILKGAVYFVTDLSREIPMATELEFMVVSSYGTGTESSGKVRILKDLDRDIQDKHVLIVEDVVDSGLTVRWLYENLQDRKPKSLKIVSLLRKPTANNLEVPINYIGFELPEEFVVGYGLDFAEKYRDMPYIGTLKKEVYQ